MADSNAVRSRRKRAHAQGDHSMCRHARPLLLPEVEPQGARFNFDPDFDPAEEMRRLAGRLAAAYAADTGNAALARELRATLLALRGPGEAADMDPELAELFRSFR